MQPERKRASVLTKRKYIRSNQGTLRHQIFAKKTCYFISPASPSSCASKFHDAKRRHNKEDKRSCIQKLVRKKEVQVTSWRIWTLQCCGSRRKCHEQRCSTFAGYCSQLSSKMRSVKEAQSRQSKEENSFKRNRFCECACISPLEYSPLCHIASRKMPCKRNTECCCSHPTY